MTRQSLESQAGGVMTGCYENFSSQPSSRLRSVAGPDV